MQCPPTPRKIHNSSPAKFNYEWTSFSLVCAWFSKLFSTHTLLIDDCILENAVRIVLCVLSRLTSKCNIVECHQCSNSTATAV